MQIIVNKKNINISKNFTLSMLLEKMNLGNWVAVFVNEKQLLIKEYDTYVLKENDNIRIIKPLGGG